MPITSVSASVGNAISSPSMLPLIRRLTTSTRVIVTAPFRDRMRPEEMPAAAFRRGRLARVGSDRNDVASHQLPLLDDEHAEVRRHVAVLVEVEPARCAFIVDLLFLAEQLLPLGERVDLRAVRIGDVADLRIDLR